MPAHHCTKPPPLSGYYRPTSPAALAPVVSGRGRRSPTCEEDLEGSPLRPPFKKSVWLLFSLTGFFWAFRNLPARQPACEPLQSYPVLRPMLSPSSNRIFQSSSIRHLHPPRLFWGGVEHNTTWTGSRLSSHPKCGVVSTGPFRQGRWSWRWNWMGTNKLAGVMVFWGLETFTLAAKGGNPGKDLPSPSCIRTTAG